MVSLDYRLSCTIVRKKIGVTVHIFPPFDVKLKMCCTNELHVEPLGSLKKLMWFSKSMQGPLVSVVGMRCCQWKVLFGCREL